MVFMIINCRKVSMPKYPNVTAKIIGEDGNAFVVLGIVQKAMRDADVKRTEIDKFIEEATSGDYDNLLRVVMNWVNVE